MEAQQQEDAIAQEQPQASTATGMQDEQAQQEQQSRMQPATQEDGLPPTTPDDVGIEVDLEPSQQPDDQPQQESPQDPPAEANVAAPPNAAPQDPPIAANVAAPQSRKKYCTFWRWFGMLSFLLVAVAAAAVVYFVVLKEDTSAGNTATNAATNVTDPVQTEEQKEQAAEEAWTAIKTSAPQQVSEVTQSSSNVTSSMKSLGLDGMKIPDLENFKPLKDDTSGGDLTVALGQAIQSFSVVPNPGRRLQTASGIELTTDPSVRIADLEDLPPSVSAKLGDFFREQDGKMVLWQEDGNWQFILHLRLKSGATMGKLVEALSTSVSSSWMSGFTSASGGGSVFVVSAACTVNGKPVEEGILLFANVGFGSVGTVANIFQALTQRLSFETAAQSVLDARAMVANLTGEITSLTSGESSNSYVLRTRVPLSEDMSDWESAFATIEVPNAQLLDTAIDYQGIVIHMSGMDDEPKVTMGGKFVLLMDTENIENGFHGTMQAELKVGQNLNLRGALNQFGNLPAPLGSLVEITNMQVEVSLDLSGTPSSPSPAIMPSSSAERLSSACIFQANGSAKLGDVRGDGWKLDVFASILFSCDKDQKERKVVAIAETSSFDLSEAFCWLADVSFTQAGLFSLPCPSGLGLELPASFQPQFQYSFPSAASIDYQGASQEVSQGATFSFPNLDMQSVTSPVVGDVISWLGLDDLQPTFDLGAPMDGSLFDIASCKYRSNGPKMSMDFQSSSGSLRSISVLFLSSASLETCTGNRLLQSSTDSTETTTLESTASDTVYRLLHLESELEIGSLPKFALSLTYMTPIDSFNTPGTFIIAGTMMERWENVAGIQNFNIDTALCILEVSNGGYAFKGSANVQLTSSLLVNMTLILGNSGGQLRALSSPGYLLDVKIPQFTLWDIAEFMCNCLGWSTCFSSFKSGLKSIGGAVDLSWSTGIVFQGHSYPLGGHFNFSFNFLGIYETFVDATIKSEPSLDATLSMGLKNFDVSDVFRNALDFLSDITSTISSTFTDGLASLVDQLAGYISFTGLTTKRSGNSFKLCMGKSKGSIASAYCVGGGCVGGGCCCEVCAFGYCSGEVCTPRVCTPEVCTPAVPPSDWELCSPWVNLDIFASPVTYLIDELVDFVKDAIPAGSFKVNELSLNNFGLNAILEGGITNLKVDVELFKDFKKKFDIQIDWSWIQPLLQGASSFVDNLVEWIAAKGAELLDEMVSFATALACNLLDDMCIGLSSGGLVNFGFDFPSWLPLSDVNVKIPSSDVKYCLKSVLPSWLTSGCNRRLQESNLDDIMAEICYEGVPQGYEPPEVLNPPPSWQVISPIPADRLQSNATHTTYCFLAHPTTLPDLGNNRRLTNKGFLASKEEPLHRPNSSQPIKQY